jgi:hypothetical protein
MIKFKSELLQKLKTIFAPDNASFGLKKCGFLLFGTFSLIALTLKLDYIDYFLGTHYGSQYVFPLYNVHT